MEQMTFDFSFSGLKIRDKVKIIGKSVGDPLPCYGWNLGDVAYVRAFRGRKSFYYLKNINEDRERSGAFLAKDLRSV